MAATIESEVGRGIAYPKLLDRATAAQQASGFATIAGQLYLLGAREGSLRRVI